jgi:hypothetical protein
MVYVTFRYLFHGSLWRPYTSAGQRRRGHLSAGTATKGMVGDVVVFEKLLALGDVCGRALPVKTWPLENLDKRLTP